MINKIEMARIKILPLIALPLLATMSCYTGKKVVEPATSVFPFSDTTTLRDGTLVYALPRTVLTVKVEAERVIEIPGPYSSFAGDLLGLDKVILSHGESWSIKNISVVSHEETDPAQYYVIRTNSIFQSNIVALKKEGLILDPGGEIVHGGLPAGIDQGFDSERFIPTDLGSDEYYIIQNDTAYRRVALDSTFIRIPYVIEKKKRLTSAQLAERAAKRLMELRDGKIMILTGETNVFPQDDAPIREINKMIQDYTELFTGKKITEVKNFVYEIIPQKDQAGTPVSIFRFSDQTGPEDNTSKTGNPVTITVTPEQKTKDIADYLPTETSSGISNSVIYRVPDVAAIKISIGNQTLHSARKLICQFGNLMLLPGNYLIGH